MKDASTTLAFLFQADPSVLTTTFLISGILFVVRRAKRRRRALSSLPGDGHGLRGLDLLSETDAVSVRSNDSELA